MFNKKKTFTLIETIIVVAIIWILMMGTTIYLQWSDEKRKIIEAQWCTSTLLWEMNNFIFYALTSKNLRISNSQTISPDFYYISIETNPVYNNIKSNIVLGYSTWNNSVSNTGDIKIFKTLNPSDTCHQNIKMNFVRTWSNEMEFITMNKWFSPVKVNNSNVFYIKWWQNEQLLIWDIIIYLCLDNNCNTQKETVKWVVDWRTQTISLKNCRFYQIDDSTKCNEREN